MDKKTNATYVCSVVFLDIVGYSKLPNRDQIRLKVLLNDTISAALKGMDSDSRLLLDTGDGAALGFLWNPEDALIFTRHFRDGVRASPEPLDVRLGINLGPVTVVEDLNHQCNMVGDGINVAQRIMSFAGRDEILVSRSFHDAVIQLAEEYAGIFSSPDEGADKHGRKHIFHRLVEPGVVPAQNNPPTHVTRAGDNGRQTSVRGKLLAGGAGLLLLAIGAFFWLSADRQGVSAIPPEVPASVVAPVPQTPVAAPSAPVPAPVAAAPVEAVLPPASEPVAPVATQETSAATSPPQSAQGQEARPAAKRPVKTVEPVSKTPPVAIARSKPEGKETGSGASPDCPSCNCADLMTKVSMGVDSLSAAQNAFFRSNCR